jgi:hypothetical protein
VHARLQSSPELRQELAHLRTCFAAHQDDDLGEEGPPRDLASRTAERIASGDAGQLSTTGRCERLTAAGDPPAGFLGWSLADLTVAGGVMLAVSMLIFPALRNSRSEARRQVCQNNLQSLFVLGSMHAQDNGGYLPQILENQHAGTFVAHLIVKGYIHPKDLAVLLVCPDSPLAEKIRDGYVFELPSAEQIGRMTPAQFARFTANASPCYAYVLPHRNENEYYYVRNDHRELSPVFSDAVGDSKTGTLTPNHGNRFIQVQFADGNLKWFKSWKLPGVDDDMSHNRRGEVASGYDPDDIVLANSSATPSGKTGVAGK